jgi:hypothetical protein
MARKSAHIQISEIPGDQYASLEAAQRSARVLIAFDLAKIMRQMLDAGLLEVRDGRIVPTGGSQHG